MLYNELCNDKETKMYVKSFKSWATSNDITAQNFVRISHGREIKSCVQMSAPDRAPAQESCFIYYDHLGLVIEF